MLHFKWVPRRIPYDIRKEKGKRRLSEFLFFLSSWPQHFLSFCDPQLDSLRQKARNYVEQGSEVIAGVLSLDIF